MDLPKTGDSFFPVTAINAGPLSDHNAIVLQLEWVDLQSRDKFSSPLLGLTRQQAVDLQGMIVKALAKLDAIQAPPEGAIRN